MVAVLISSLSAAAVGLDDGLEAGDTAPPAPEEDCAAANVASTNNATAIDANLASEFLRTVIIGPSSGVNAALTNCIRHTIDGQHVCRDAVVDVVSFGVADHILKRGSHDGFQLLVDDGFFPEIALAVLDPFEVGRRDAAGVGENVGDHEDALVG